MKPGLPRDRHKAIGLRLAQLSDELTALECEVLNAYPKNATRAPGAALTNAIRRLRTARFALENACAREAWHENNECVGLYWPDPRTGARCLPGAGDEMSDMVKRVVRSAPR